MGIKFSWGDMTLPAESQTATIIALPLELQALISLKQKPNRLLSLLLLLADYALGRCCLLLIIAVVDQNNAPQKISDPPNP